MDVALDVIVDGDDGTFVLDDWFLTFFADEFDRLVDDELFVVDAADDHDAGVGRGFFDRFL